MSFAETVLLGAVAGSTIFIGLPLGRLRVVGNRGRVALAMFAVGVLAFLFADIFEHALGIVEEPVEAFEEGAYEIEVTRADGSQVDVHLDKGFNVLSQANDSDQGGEDDSGDKD